MFNKKHIFVLLIFLFLLFLINCSTPTPPAAPELSVIFLDVGQGDATLVFLPNGVTMLIDVGDGANPYSERDAGRDIVGPFLRSNGIEYIDYLIFTHPHRDHMGGGLQFLYQIDVGQVLISGQIATAKYYENLIRFIQQKNIPLKTVSRGDTLDFDDIENLRIEFLHPDDISKYNNPNDVSIVTYIRYGDVAYLITGDVETQVESSIVSDYPDLTAQILRTGHHGSSTSSSQRFLNSIQPEVAIISCAEKNRFNHPSKQIVKRLEKMEIDTYMTFIHGHIEIVTDGETYRIVTQR
jgi:competence protein ComEC